MHVEGQTSDVLMAASMAGSASNNLESKSKKLYETYWLVALWREENWTFVSEKNCTQVESAFKLYQLSQSVLGKKSYQFLFFFFSWEMLHSDLPWEEWNIH